ncbi:MAG: tRNA lysidine(34) synthetase TilS [Alphaproteobacteria bacterium]|nr:tRNA lysidine(34) synthetase TilS [Alphaproteobacteria bacterium]MBN2779984.1 tRNA lysidine(34) synthetase TilS [Alphaproteobacteria bacterium]
MKDKFDSLKGKEISKIILAVSGGADSMAMAHLFTQSNISKKMTAIAVTIDHSLRPDSQKEAALVGQWIEKMGLSHHILKWVDGAKTKTNIEQRAREARYDLLIDFAHKEKAQAILIGHHQDDQIESFFLALNRGSGVKGLSGMKAIRKQKGVQIIRPLLENTKAELKTYCEQNKIPYVNDPMNEDEKFARVRIRKNRKALGLEDKRIQLAMKNLARAQDAIDFYVDETIERMTRHDGTWFIHPLLESPAEVALRALGIVIQKVGGQTYLPELEKLERLYAKLKQKESFKMTLGSCILSADKLTIKVEKQ